MPFSPETIAEKSYNQCIRCEHIGIRCDGPNVISMDLERYCEWCRLRKEDLGWSVDKLAEVSGIGRATVAKIISGKISGLNGETISAITCALIYGYDPQGKGWGKYPCAMMALEREKQQTPVDPCQECARLREQLADSQKKIEYLKDQGLKHDQLMKDNKSYLKTKDFYIRLFLSAFGVSLVGNIFMLIWIISKLL